MQPIQIVAFTDGACLGNGTDSSHGGIGVIFPDHPGLQLSEPVPSQPQPTNNRCEMVAVLRAVQQSDMIDPACKLPLLIKSDSQLMCSTVNCWLEGWKRAGWKKQDGKPPANLDVLIDLDALLQRRRVCLVHVKAHTKRQDTDSAHNAAADRLANKAAIYSRTASFTRPPRPVSAGSSCLLCGSA